MSSAPLPTTQNLPVELWMRIFDVLQLDDHVRWTVKTRYWRQTDSNDKARDAGDVHLQDIHAAMMTMPLFERVAWRNAVAFYAINHNSRAAALRLRLAHKLFLRCKRPTRAPLVKYKRVFQFGYGSLEPYIPRRSPHLVVELFHTGSSVYHPDSTDFTFFAKDVDWMIARDSSVLSHIKLRAAKHVTVLAYAPHNSECCPDWYSLYHLTVLKTAVEQFWVENNLKDRRVHTYL